MDYEGESVMPDTRYMRTEAKKKKSFDRTFVAIWLFLFVLGIAFWGGVIYVALHFLMKVW
jgi:hypothetical protein